MHGKLSSRARPLFRTISLWLCGIALLFLIKVVIEMFKGPIAETSIDFNLRLIAYVFFFFLATPANLGSQPDAQKRQTPGR